MREFHRWEKEPDVDATIEKLIQVKIIVKMKSPL